VAFAIYELQHLVWAPEFILDSMDVDNPHETIQCNPIVINPVVLGSFQPLCQACGYLLVPVTERH